MKLLLAIDESDYSRAALDAATELGWPAGTSALLITCVRSDTYLAGEIYAQAAQEIEELVRAEIERAEARLRTLVPELEAAGVSVKTLVMRGDPRFAIVDTAKEEKTDLIVVGSHGRSGLKKLLLGSVASHVVTHAPCSVLVAKAPKVARA